MRTVASFLLSSLALLVACGGKPKQADDPSNESTHSSSGDDGTQNTKWDGTSSTPTSTATPSSATSSATGKGPAVSSVNEGSARRQDQYDKDATEVVIKRAARQVQANCGAAKDDSGKAVGPWGKTTITIALGHNGHSKGVTVPSPYQGKQVGSCIEKAFTNLTYPPWGGSDADVQWEVELVQPAPEGGAKK